MGSSKDGIDKLRIVQKDISATGIIGLNEYDFRGQSSLRILVEGAAAGTVVTILSSIEEASFMALGTMTGSGTKVMNTTTWDFIRFQVTTYTGTPFDMYIAGWPEPEIDISSVTLAPGADVDSAVLGQNAAETDVVSVGTTATLLRTGVAGLTGRNHISVVNRSTTQTLFYGYSSSVTADLVVGPGSTSGIPIGPGGIENIDVDATVSVYAIYPTSAELVNVQEIGKV